MTDEGQTLLRADRWLRIFYVQGQYKLYVVASQQINKNENDDDDKSGKTHHQSIRHTLLKRMMMSFTGLSGIKVVK